MLTSIAQIKLPPARKLGASDVKTLTEDQRIVYGLGLEKYENGQFGLYVSDNALIGIANFKIFIVGNKKAYACNFQHISPNYAIITHKTQLMHAGRLDVGELLHFAKSPAYQIHIPDDMLIPDFWEDISEGELFPGTLSEKYGVRSILHKLLQGKGPVNLSYAANFHPKLWNTLYIETLKDRAHAKAKDTVEKQDWNQTEIRFQEEREEGGGVGEDSAGIER